MLPRRSKYDERSFSFIKDNVLLCNHRTKSFNLWLMTDLIVPSFLAGNRS